MTRARVACVIASALFLAGICHAQERSLLSIGRCETAPVIDGNLGADEWASATIIGGAALTNGKPARLTFRAAMMYDDAGIYIQAVSEIPDLSILRASATERDGAAFSDDCYEIFLDPDPTRPAEYFHLVTNSIDTHYDGVGAKDSSWNGEWLSSSVVEELAGGRGLWTIEIAVPFETLGAVAPADGDAWRFNVCRTWFWKFVEEGHGPERYISFAPTMSGYHAPERFADLRFVGDGPVAGIVDVPFEVEREATLTIQARGATEAFAVEVVADTKQAGEVGSLSGALLAGEETGFELDLSGVAETSDVTVQVTVADPASGAAVLRQTSAVRVRPAFELTLTPAFFAQKLLADIDVTRLAGVPRGATARLQLIQGEALAEAAVSAEELADGLAGTELSLADVEAGACTVSCRLLRSDGSALATQLGRLRVPEAPEWVGNELGVTDEVLAPWTPIEVDGERVSCWGRTHDLSGFGLPRSIQAAGEELLAGPIGLSARVNGTRGQLGNTGGEWTRRDANRVEFTGLGSLAGMDCRMSASIEYDGFIHYEVTLDPQGDAMVIEALDLDIPFAPERAVFVRGLDLYHHSYGKHAFYGYVNGEIWNMGWPDKEWQWQNGPLSAVWIGDDDRGLMWETNSLQHWHNTPGSKVIEFDRRDDRTSLLIHVINEPTTVTGPISYDWFLQATPVKPSFERDRRVHVSWHGTLDDTLKEAGADFYSVWWVTWGDKFGYLDTTLEREKYMVARARASEQTGIGLLPYTSQCSTTLEAPEVEPYAVEWEALPGGRQAHKGYTMFRVCPGTAWADLQLWLVNKAIDKYAIGGLYYDVSHAVGCTNELHGHGWVDENGVRQPEHPVLELRAMYKRLYALVHERIEGGLIFAHQASVFEGYSHPWTDVATYGEYWLGIHSYEPLTLERMRAEYDVRQYGVPYHFFPALNQWRAKPIHPMEELLSFTLLHDTIPTDVGTESEEIKQVWRIYREFDTQHAQWVPYYQAEGWVSAEPEAVKVSLYHRDGDNLLVVANPSYEDATGTVTVDLQRLVGGATPTAVDMRSGDAVTMQEGSFSIELPARRMTLIRISR